MMLLRARRGNGLSAPGKASSLYCSLWRQSVCTMTWTVAWFSWLESSACQAWHVDKMPEEVLKMQNPGPHLRYSESIVWVKFSPVSKHHSGPGPGFSHVSFYDTLMCSCLSHLTLPENRIANCSHSPILACIYIYLQMIQLIQSLLYTHFSTLYNTQKNGNEAY